MAVWAELLFFPLATPVLWKEQPGLNATVQDPARVKVMWGAQELEMCQAEAQQDRGLVGYCPAGRANPVMSLEVSHGGQC